MLEMNFIKNTFGKGYSIISKDVENYIPEMESELLDSETGLVNIHPWALWDKYPTEAIKLFCRNHHIWIIPTDELLECLDHIIGVNENAIEVACGMGIIGRELQMPLTDSKLHENLISVAEKYNDTLGVAAAIETNTMKYPRDVERLTAQEAVDKYHPDTVLICNGVPLWTEERAIAYMQHYHEEMRCSELGIDYLDLFKKVNKIIAVANENIIKCSLLSRRKHKFYHNYGFRNNARDMVAIRVWQK